MMLNAYLPKIEQRYVFVGSAVGAALPATFFAISKVSGYGGSFIEWAMENPSQFTLAAMPAWMALVALQFARNRKRDMQARILREQQERQLLHDALHDHLTGMKNRAAFHGAARRLVGEPGSYALLLLDLDKFKIVNDTRGHQAGDQLLVAVAARLEELERKAVNVSIYRLGGDEFAVLVKSPFDRAQLADLGRQIETLICSPFEVSDSIVNIGVSIGIAEAQRPTEPVEDVMQRADLALYSAKDRVESTHMFYDREIADASMSRLQMERDLIKALASDEFVLEFQPVLSSENGQVVAMEAMARWLHPQKGFIASDRFLPAAERSGLTRKIDAWLLNAACMEAAKWPQRIGVSVSISKAEFEDDNFPAHVVRCLDRSGLPAQCLTIELSESVVALGLQRVKERLAQLHALGVRVALHDFGLSLHALNEVIAMDVDGLKLERSLARSVLTGSRGADVMETMMQFGAAMKVANNNNGAEADDRSIEFIRHRGATQVLGYLSSKPIAAAAVADFISKQSDAETALRA